MRTSLDARADIPDVMADLDVLVLASVEPESYGLVLVEALASGNPVVATDDGGPPEIVQRAVSGTALAVPPGDANALASAQLTLLPSGHLSRTTAGSVRAFTAPPRGSARSSAPSWVRKPTTDQQPSTIPAIPVW